ncbi:MAG: hypothetical protein U0324_04020 [Polyangiales bacterium]
MIRSTALALALALSLGGAAASASPLLGEGSLPAAAHRSLAATIRAERAAHPERFARVHGLVGVQGRFYRTTRSQHPEVTRELRALGPEALLPMLDALAFSEYPRALTPEERDALELGLLDAVGALRDRRAEPVLRAAFTRLTNSESVRAAARALGALAGDGEVATLAAAAREQGPRQAAALEGLGVSRRADAARTIVEVLDASSDPDALAGAARGLAAAGSTWATAADGRAVALPAGTADALARAFVRAPAARSELQVALAATASQETLAALARARSGADAETARRLESAERIVRRSLGR